MYGMMALCVRREFKSWFSPVTLKALVKYHLHVKQGRCIWMLQCSLFLYSLGPIFNKT